MNKVSLLWVQAAACGGDSMALLCHENPDIISFIENSGIELLWHPSLSVNRPGQYAELIESLVNGSRKLDLLCVEGALVNGPEGTGMADPFLDRPKRDIIRQLCNQAEFVFAVGTCASYGGIPAAPPNPMDVTGLQWLQDKPGGLLSAQWISRGGTPVINLTGCPVHPAIIVQTLTACILLGEQIKLDQWNRPHENFNTMVHQGCTRNEYHEYDVEETDFGGKGCLFFNLGCQGPRTIGACNSILWNNQKSKPRAGVPCFGCTSPLFPMDTDFFKTEKIGDIPVELPDGVSRPNYMAYKGLAKAATPQRLKDRSTEL